MITYLRTREHYEDLYDEWTVESCRRMASHEPEIRDEDFAGQKLTAEQLKAMKEIRRNWAGVARELAVFTYAAERFNNKDQAIDDWMRKDREKDERLAKIQPPDHVRCRECLSTNLRLISKDEHWGERDSKQERLLFMYKCNRCDTNTAYFDNGEQYHVKPTLCPQCNTDKPTHVTKEAKHKYTITYTCRSCGHVWKEIMDFTPTPKPPPDPNYVKDRKLYCYSDKVREYAESVRRVGPLLKEFSEHREQQEKINAFKDDLAKINRLTIPQVIEKLKPVIEKADYIELKFAEPEIGRDVFVGFSCMDRKSERAEYDSCNALKKTVTKILADTNWRLMSDGIHYRLGYLTGRLRAYEREEDLVELAKRASKKKSAS